jgi:hypothetical protein
MGQIRPPVAPNLPLPPPEYAREYHDRHDNALRLYFNQVSNSLQQLLRGFNQYAVLLNTGDLTAAVANTAYPVTYTTTAESSGIALNGGSTSQILATVAGVYLFDVSVQLDSAGAAGYAYTWFRVNGVDTGSSASRHYVASGTAETVANRTLVLKLSAGDYVEIVWAASDTALLLSATAATAPVPAIPSVRLSVYYLFPDNA